MTDSAPRGDEDVGLFQKDPSMFSHSVARGLPLCALVLMLSAHPVLAEDSADQSAIIVTASPIVEEAAARVSAMVQEGAIITPKGTRIETRIDTVCLHGDEPSAVTAARTVRARLEADGVTVAPL